MEQGGTIQRPGVVTGALVALAFTAVMFALTSSALFAGAIPGNPVAASPARWIPLVTGLFLVGPRAIAAAGLWFRRAWARRFSSVTLGVFALLFLGLPFVLGFSGANLLTSSINLMLGAIYGGLAFALLRSEPVRLYLCRRGSGGLSNPASPSGA